MLIKIGVEIIETDRLTIETGDGERTFVITPADHPAVKDCGIQVMCEGTLMAIPRNSGAIEIDEA
jgi:hypothetical protein